MMAIRRAALSRFGEQAIKRDEPMATIEEVLVPLYLHHRYQVEAAASTVGGHLLHLRDARRRTRAGEVRAGGRTARGARRAARHAHSRRSWRCRASCSTRFRRGRPATATRASSSRATRARCSTRSRRPSSPSDMTIGLSARRCARGAAGGAARARSDAARARDASSTSCSTSTFAAPRARTPYEAEIARAVQRVVVERLMTLAATADMPQVRAIATPEAAAARAALDGDAADQRQARPRTRRCSRRTSSGSSIARSRRRRAPTSRPRLPGRRSAIRGWIGWDGWRRSASWEWTDDGDQRLEAQGSGLRQDLRADLGRRSYRA